MSNSIKWWIDILGFYSKFQVHPLYDIKKLCTNTFLAFIQHHYWVAEGMIVTIFHIWPDPELVMLILDTLKLWLHRSPAAPDWKCVKHPNFEFVASLQQYLLLEHVVHHKFTVVTGIELWAIVIVPYLSVTAYVT